ncbi:unnamed protein product [Cercospora beticola]|nr:unnamed protein product [Cercospora beticola]
MLEVISSAQSLSQLFRNFLANVYIRLREALRRSGDGRLLYRETHYVPSSYQCLSRNTDHLSHQSSDQVALSSPLFSNLSTTPSRDPLCFCFRTAPLSEH